MCRLFALTSTDPVSPMEAVQALDVMREGHDGSGVGLYLTGLDGAFGKMPDTPILSAIVTEQGEERLMEFMRHRGYTPGHRLSMSHSATLPAGTPARHAYLVQAFEPPAGWDDLSQKAREEELLATRVALKIAGLERDDITVFSFWPDVVMVKEIGDPLSVGEYLGLDHHDFYARTILAQGRQNTNYAINLYACHPFFIQGICTMTNGENTAFVPIREYLESQNITGYTGYHSDSEVFAHILHYTMKRLGLPLQAYKHIITPLSDAQLAAHADGDFLARLKMVCRKMIIDGPNCVIGVTPDRSMFMVQDKKKLRPGVVGGRPGLYAFSSEVCGLDAVIPDRDKSADFQPMHLDTAIVSPQCEEIEICRQTQPLPHLR